MQLSAQTLDIAFAAIEQMDVKPTDGNLQAVITAKNEIRVAFQEAKADEEAAAREQLKSMEAETPAPKARKRAEGTSPARAKTATKRTGAAK